MIKLSDYVIKFLCEQGVQHVFLLPGGGCMHLVDSLGRNPHIQYVCNLNEQAVSIAAEAYAQYTNNLGVGLVTTGPGCTNAITGIAAAWVDSTPCLMISGQVKRPDLTGNSGLRQLGMQEIDIVSIVKPITKYAETVMDPQQIRYHLEKAIYMVKNGRPGPVWLDIPLDVQAATIDETELKGFSADKQQVFSITDTSLRIAVKSTIQLLMQAKRPCILVGNGVRLANAEYKFQRLVEMLKVPVLTTWKAADFFDDAHPCYFGRPGSIGQRGANFIQQNADFLLVLGARLDFGQTGYNHEMFAPRAQKVVVDIDLCEIQKLKMDNLHPVNSDAGAYLDYMLKQLAGCSIPKIDAWIQYCQSIVRRYPVVEPHYYDETQYVNPYVLIDVISGYLDHNAIIVPGSSGMCSEATMQAFRVKKGQRILNNQGFGAMGFGLPASIGVCLASGHKPVVCINGDGGFQLNIQELETVSRLMLPIKFFILNNEGYGSITNTQRNYFNGFYVASDKSSGLTLPDICRLAGVYGIRSLRIRNHNELKEHVACILDNDDPVICDVIIDPLQIARPKTSSVILENGSMRSRPLEDMWPFLDRLEFDANMAVSKPLEPELK